MTPKWCVKSVVAVLLIVVSGVLRAADVSQAEWEQMRKDLDELRKWRSTAQTAAPVHSNVERALDSKYGPNAPVTTKNGKLTISGLVQVWYYTYQKDNNGLFQGAGAGGGDTIIDTNEGQQNSSFRIRRTELKFTMDIHENVTGVIMIDPAREATSFPNMTDNQINSSIFKRIQQVAPEDVSTNKVTGSTGNIAGVQSGVGAVPRLLQDAYINYHGVIPHHDFQVGQFKPWIGEEGIRSSAQLDFVERSFVGQIADARDTGISFHGTWWDDRFQYWGGVFNGVGNYLGSGGQFQNRVDDNDQKDFNYRILVRPLWGSHSDCGCEQDWGKMELGISGIVGEHGQNSTQDPLGSPLNGLNRTRTWAQHHQAWFYYAPGGVVRGLWVRAEGAYVHDRNSPNAVVDLQGNGVHSADVQGDPQPTSVWGGYAAIGYKLSESRFADCGCDWVKNFEFALRYDQFQNVQVADPAIPERTNNYRTQVYTAGVNYYIKGHDAKIQLNYNNVSNPQNAIANFHNVRNDSFVVNFQVAF